MNLPNIAFIGKAGAGKTTAAEVLGWFPHLGYQRISFAEPLKVMLDTSIDRQRLQEFGTDVVRRYEPDAWIRLFFWHLALKEQVLASRNEALRATPRVDRWANDDCRFPNELEALRDKGWIIVEVQAPLHVRLDRLRLNGKLTDEAQLDHESENSLDDVTPDYAIQNATTESDLAVELQRVLEQAARR